MIILIYIYDQVKCVVLKYETKSIWNIRDDMVMQIKTATKVNIRINRQ